MKEAVTIRDCPNARWIAVLVIIGVIVRGIKVVFESPRKHLGGYLDKIHRDQRSKQCAIHNKFNSINTHETKSEVDERGSISIEQSCKS